MSYDDGGTEKTIKTRTKYDGWGRAIEQVTFTGTEPGSSDTQVNTEYDAMGRVASRTNPFGSGGTPGAETSYEYDALGRVTETTLPDGDTVETSYDGDEVTIIDQVNRKIKRESDGLGRLVKVTEQNSSGTLSQETDYTYDLLDRLMEVDQGGQLRKYKYDGLGRLLFEKIPEQTATINDGTGTYWTTKLTYTDFDAVETKTDARGVITTYEYDELNRLETVSYNTSGASGVAATPTVSYEYGTEGEETGQLMSVEVGTLTSGGYKLEYIYDVYGRVSSVKRWFSATQSYTTSYQMNEANQRKQLTYPSSRVENYSYDSKGRLKTAGEVNSISYNIAGQMTSWRIGDDDDNITESYSYDTERLQMTNQTVERTVTECYFQPSPPAVICDPVTTTLMDVDYDYEAAAGEMGASTTAGNAGQLMGISGTIDSQSESAAFTYDNVGRLVTSTQTTNSVTAKRQFDYDRWGNRTAVWDAVTGGTQIQSVSLVESSSIPNNQVESVTENSATSDYTYDAAGNVTDDDVNTFVYDAKNRLVSINSGAEQYKYDHQNRRVAKTVGSVTTQYIWEGSKVIAEHAASTSNVLVDYIFMGGRMVKKVEGSVTRYIVSDRLSARMMLDEDYDVVGKQSHLPFGEAMAESGEQEKHKFTSYERDTSTGLDYAVNRWHSAGVGRFLQADPYRASGGIKDPQSWNRYRYSRNDPVNIFDPLGLEDVIFGLTLGSIDVFAQWHLPGSAEGPEGNPMANEGFGEDGVAGNQSPGFVLPEFNVSLLKLVEDFFRLKGNCRTFFLNRIATGDTIFHEGMLGQIKSLLQDKNVYWNDITQIPAVSNRTFPEMKWSLPEGLTDPNITIGVYLRDYAYGRTQMPSRIVFLGEAYKKASERQKMITIIHEALHIIFYKPGDPYNNDHGGITDHLGIKGDKGSSSANLDAWLENDCRNPATSSNE